MSEQSPNADGQDNQQKEGITSETTKPAKPGLSLSKLTSKFSDARRGTPPVTGPTYAEQMESKSPSASAITEAFSPSKLAIPSRTLKTSTRPFSEFRQTELGKRVQIQLPKPVDLALRVHAASTGNSVTYIIDIALEDYLKKHGIKI